MKEVKKRNLWIRILRFLLILVTLVVTFGVIVAAYGGYYPPSEYRGLCLMVMTFPIWLLSLLVLAVIDLLLCRKAFMIALIGFVATIPSIWDYCPLNITSADVPAEARGRTFTLLTYNITNFTDMTGTYPDSINPTLSYILHSGADVVNLQECSDISVDKAHCVTSAQIDSLYQAYPYVMLYGKSQCVLSKYPAEVLDIGQPVKGVNEIAAVRLNIEGELITLFDVHLASYRLTRDDKSLFREVTDLKADNKAELVAVRSQLISKIQKAAETRELDCLRLMRYIRHFGGPNVIVAGDFNDVPGCFTLRKLEELQLRPVYPEVGFGPMVTFNNDRFYFRIDHVLYRGDLLPISLKKGKVRYSDHYPLKVTFALTGR